MKKQVKNKNQSATDDFAILSTWFHKNGWQPLPFQYQTWHAIAHEKCGLIHATTGSGKTYAIWLGALYKFGGINNQLQQPLSDIQTSAKISETQISQKKINQAQQKISSIKKTPPPLTVLWITPMRALASDTLQALQAPLSHFNSNWQIGLRTSDTSDRERAKQARRFPTALITTPESLTLILARTAAKEDLAHVKMIVVDEWHELIANKRGVQTQLAIARLLTINPNIQIWGLSATLGNNALAADILLAPKYLPGQQYDSKKNVDTKENANNVAKSNKKIATHHLDLVDAIPDVQTANGILLHTNLEDFIPKNNLNRIKMSRQRLPCLISGNVPKKIIVDTLIPETIERFPWGGHLNTRLVLPLAKALDDCRSALIFANTRSQAEIWFQSLLDARPDLAGLIALHHGSLDKSVRVWVENGLKNGALRIVVCTSSLDLGVDFAPVDRVFQIGSPKGIARLLQRAGRSGHAPGQASRITIVPTHALELIEAAAARHAVAAQQIESRLPPLQSYDVLIQHLATCALSGGFSKEALYREVTKTWSYQNLKVSTFDWALAFLGCGGQALTAYPDYQRLSQNDKGHYIMPRKDLARRHRLNIGTIVGQATMQVVLSGGKRIGQIEESFAARLKIGDVFIFAGRAWEVKRCYEMNLYVKPSRSKQGVMPQWLGAKMPLSTELANATVRLIDHAAHYLSCPQKQILSSEQLQSHSTFHQTQIETANISTSIRKEALKDGLDSKVDLAYLTFEPEIQAALPLLALQARQSILPKSHEILVELMESREGFHCFCYPFAGRTVHLGLAALFAWRAAHQQANTFSISVSDYGFELLSANAIDWPALFQKKEIFSVNNLAQDTMSSLNASEMAKRRFREIARIAGLIVDRYPTNSGAGKSNRQLQASAALFYEVFKQHDCSNRLLEQAHIEVLIQELDYARLAEALTAFNQQTVCIHSIRRATPFAFPLMIIRLREHLSTEKLAERIQRMLLSLEKNAYDEFNKRGRRQKIRIN